MKVTMIENKIQDTTKITSKETPVFVIARRFISLNFCTQSVILGIETQRSQIGHMKQVIFLLISQKKPSLTIFVVSLERSNLLVYYLASYQEGGIRIERT